MDKITEAVKRVTEMEGIYDQALNIMDNVENSPEEFLGFQKELMRLADYYSSQDWKDDFALDEEGKLPQDLKRGVLSEDGVYNLLERNKELLKERGNEGLEEADETRYEVGHKVYPNDPCPCGSGKKYKKCCGKV
jgi:preprotein translocase subunit SecA